MLLWDFADYSGNDAARSLPLFVSPRTQQLLLAVLTEMQQSYNWLNSDDTILWDDIDAQLGETIYEVLDPVMPDFTPVGITSAWFGEIADIPDKWLLCDDTLYDGDDYPELYAVIAAIFKDGSGNFRTPSMQDRFVKVSGINDDVGETGGENEHVLTIAEMPAHTHSILKASAVASQNARAAQGNNTALANQATGSEGGGGAHNNQPAYIAAHWIIKALP